MFNQPGSKRRFDDLKGALGKWRLAFLIFALVYTAILLLSLIRFPMEWDEVTHLNSALYLRSGLFNTFINNAFYPPLFDCATALSFNFMGISLLSARLVSALFSILSLWLVFELAYRMYSGKIALLSTVLLGIMPGYFWLSRLALLEIMLLFFVVLSIFLFYFWLQKRQDRFLVFSGLAIGLGFLTKYQMIFIVAIIVFGVLFLFKGHLKQAFSRLSLLIISAVIVIVPWIIIAYQVFAMKILDQWLYALQVGNPEKLVYSSRFPAPLFYFIEMVWPYNNIHPISIFLYVAGLAGLGFLAWRRGKEDKFILIWFFSILVFFTLIVNKEWRYVFPLFPVLAISASILILLLSNKLNAVWWKKGTVNRRLTAKLSSVLFIILVASAMAYSINDAYSIASTYDIRIEIEPSTFYALKYIQNNESIMILGPFNFFNQEMVKFYLMKNGNYQIKTYQYPTLPVDTYTPNFKISELIELCKQNNVKYLFTYENGGTVPYFNTTLNLQQIYEQIYNSGNFSKITDEATFGTNPRRIFILTYIG